MAATNPTAVVVPPRILRRVIRTDRRLKFFGGGAPRQTSYAISGETLGAIVNGEELGRQPAQPWPERVVLIACPEPDELARADPGALLTTAWRRLFRARIQAEIRKALDRGTLDASGLDARIGAIGRTEFEEARAVLVQDGRLAPECGDSAVFEAFAAAFLDLSRFAPGLLAYTFPALEDQATIEALLAADVDATALLAGSRPAGAPDPAEAADEPVELPDHDPIADRPRQSVVDAWGEGSGRGQGLAAKAKAASTRGNSVRAALLWAGSAARSNSEIGRAAARSELKHLADRLTRALFVRKGESETWADALAPLLRSAPGGFWSPEARMLYDLQKVCIDHEREVFRLDAIGWVLSLGRQPLKRPLPHLRLVAISNHLRSAAKRLPAVKLTREERGRLEGLFRSALHRVEHDLREQFRPTIESTLAETWVPPRDLPERVARGKLVEELLDRIVGRGFSSLGDLRDAASKGDLKLPDLASPSEFLRGDRLLKTDHALADRLDGVHRRGEIYLRWLQRLSSLAFGTAWGRTLTRFVVLPFGGAFVVLKGLQEIDELVVVSLTELMTHRPAIHHEFVNEWSILLLGSVALAAINFARFRSRLVGAIRSFGRALRAVFLDLPTWLLNNPVLLRVLGSEVVAAVWTIALKPLTVAGPVWLIAWLAGAGPIFALSLALAVFALACLAFNTRAGRALEEVVAEKVVRALRVIGSEVVPGLFRIVMSEFQRILEWVEKVIYAVDEWLRFRKGQSTAVLAFKAMLGLAWGVVAYLVRIYVNLLIEPQINPIKHFPVVTVSHKVILPMSIRITRVFAAALTPFLGRDLAIFVAGANVLLLPGVFGFLVWELKSNWRLYEANRPEALGPVVVGEHGETISGLLRPGFHSGTLPKLFGRLRRARRVGRDGAALKRREGLHHVEESLRRFVDRDLAALLAETRTLGRLEIRTGSIHLATNRIRIELVASGFEGTAFWFDLEERGRLLHAGISRPGWLASLDVDGRSVLGDALAGFFKRSGVDRIIPTPDASVDRPDPAIAGFADVVVRWTDWVAAWDLEASNSRTLNGRRSGWLVLPPTPLDRPAGLRS